MGPRMGLKRRDGTQTFLQNLPWVGISQGALLGTSLFDVGRWVKKALVFFVLFCFFAAEFLRALNMLISTESVSREDSTIWSLPKLIQP